ncbi:hypothetical protein CHELA1G11_21064 [Hyphomicrobiales bacterium]|nr:hypothetical protein CHELA1G11_21064 [Hyphomicrobiales bacterium]CAH1693143.1 hypothetical protein CHELA1G2_21372 [Hyphomicrobiales bacterium]
MSAPNMKTIKVNQDGVDAEENPYDHVATPRMSEALRKAWAEAKAPVRRLLSETVDPYPARVSAAQVAVIARNTYPARRSYGAR